MPHWKLKAGVHAVISRLPDSQRWNRLLQHRVSGQLLLTEAKFLAKWDWAATHISGLHRETGHDVSGKTVVEIGTGWYPVVPVALALLGAQRVFTIDVQDVLNRTQVQDTLGMCLDLIEQDSLPGAVPAAAALLRGALAAPANANATEVLDHVGVTAIVGDVPSTGLTANSVDLITSDSTLEHVVPETIGTLFRDLRELARSTAIMSHHIDMADHFSIIDDNITVYNFLQYSDRRWSWYNNSLNYQNRLRINDYRALHEANGWRVIDEHNTSKTLQELHSVKLSARFANYDEEDLAVHSTWMLSIVDGADPT